MADGHIPQYMPLPKAEDYMPAAKAAKLMRHCTNVLQLADGRHRVDHIVRLAKTDRDFRRYFETVLRADPFTDEGDKGGARAWFIGVGIVLDAIGRQRPTHPNHRAALEIWPVMFGARFH